MSALHRSLDGALVEFSSDDLELDGPASASLQGTLQGVHLEFISGPLGLAESVGRHFDVSVAARATTSSGELVVALGQVPMGDVDAPLCLGYWLGGESSVRTHFYGDNVDFMMELITEPEIEETSEGPYLASRDSIRLIKEPSVIKDIPSIGVATVVAPPRVGVPREREIKVRDDKPTETIIESLSGEASLQVLPDRARDVAAVVADVEGLGVRWIK